MRISTVALGLFFLGCGARGGGGGGAAGPQASSTIALTSDDRALWVVNPDADSVSVIDPATRALVAEIALGRGAAGGRRGDAALRAERQAARARHLAR